MSGGGAFADVGSLGILPLQHHDPDWPLEDRIVLFAGRPKRNTKDDPLGLPSIDRDKATGEDTYGDVLGTFFWARDGAKRKSSAWWLGPVPSVVSASDPPAPREGQTLAPGSSSRGSVRPLASTETADARFVGKSVGTPSWATRLPTGWTGLTASTTNPTQQIETFLPAFLGLVASNLGNPEVGTRVFDTAGNSVDPKRWAWLQDLVDVVDFGKGGQAGIDGRGLAVQLGQGGRSDSGPGYALHANADHNEVAVGNQGWGGLFHSGEGFCQHALGATADGRAIRPLHAPHHALFLYPGVGDAPLAFSARPWIRPTEVPSPIWQEVHLRLDRETSHVAGRAAGVGLWRWQTPAHFYVPDPIGDRWPPPPGGDGDPPPGVGGGPPPFPPGGGGGGGGGKPPPGGGGGGGGSRGPLQGPGLPSGGGIGVIPNPFTPIGSGPSSPPRGSPPVSPGKPQKPQPPTTDGGDSGIPGWPGGWRGGPGGNGYSAGDGTAVSVGGFKDYPGDDEGADGIEADEPIVTGENDYPGDDEGADGIEVEDYNYPGDPDAPPEPRKPREPDIYDWAQGILDGWETSQPHGDTRLTIESIGVDNEGDAEATGPQIGTVDGQTPKVGQEGAYYPAHPTSVAMITVPGVNIRATATTAGEFDPTGSSAPLTPGEKQLVDGAPIVGTFIGLAQGTGTWTGYPTARSTIYPPRGAGVIVPAPPDVTKAQILDGTAATKTSFANFAVLLQKNLAGLSFGTFNQTAGKTASGVLMKGDSAGLLMTNQDSNGVTIAGSSFRFGEAGVVITGKLTVTGRIDPTTLEFTDTAVDNIPNGTAGFRFDSATNIRPLWKQKGSPYTTSPLALYSDIGASGLPSRYVSGLVIRYASSSTVTVSAGKARDKADGADMTLASQVTVSTATVNAALGYERKTLTGTATWTLASATVTGSGTAFLTEFGTRALTVGTITNAGATLTGTSTKFLSEVAVNDLIGNATSGYYQVTAIASDTSLTLATYPSAVGKTDFSGSSANVIEQPLIESAGGKRHPLYAIASDTSLTITNVALSTETGVACYATAGVRSPAEAGWRAVWLASGGSGTTVFLSTQRTTPYGSISGYTTSYRRIGWVRINSSGNIIPAYGSDGTGFRWTRYETDVATTGAACRCLANASSTTSWQSFACEAVVPPTARAIQGLLFSLSPNTAVAVQIRGRGLGDSAVGRQRLALAPSTTGFNSLLVDVPCDGAQWLDHGCQAGGPTGDGSYFDVLAYEDTLE